MAQHHIAWHNTVLRGTAQHGMAWHDVAQHGALPFGPITTAHSVLQSVLAVSTHSTLIQAGAAAKLTAELGAPC